MQLNRTMCCGLRELHGIQDIAPDQRGYVRSFTSSEIISFVVTQMTHNGRNGAFVTFAAADGHGPMFNKVGEDLAKYIRAKKLGTLSAPRASRNPNSENMLRVWLWRVDRVALRKWKPSKTK